MDPRFYILSGIISLGLASVARGETARLRPVADTNLFENAPDNNLGATAAFQVGRNNNGMRGRGLYKFDPAAAGIPAGSLIHSASLTVHVTKTQSALATVHNLHRVRLDWTGGEKEGDKGEAADPGEATWCARMQGEHYWTVPGGQTGADFSSPVSASATLDGAGSYTFPSTPSMVATVQAWVDGTAPNYGWALISSDESTDGNTRRIGASELAGSEPVLTIDYTPFEITDLREIGGGRWGLEWSAGRPPFEIDVSNDGVNWTTVPDLSLNGQSGNVAGELGNAVFRVLDNTADPDTSARYRVRWDATWSAATHPNAFPPGPHFSDLIGGTHNETVSFWSPGSPASPGIEDMAEEGGTTLLSNEVNAAIVAGSADSVLLGDYIPLSPGSTSLDFDINQSHPLVTLVTMIAPSPDWFVGVHGLNLFDGGQWLLVKTIPLYPHDAGTDAGTSYLSDDANINPGIPISELTGAPFLDAEKLRPFGTLTFARID